MGQLQSIEGELKSLGYQILAISPDAPEDLKGTSAKHELGYRLLSDGDFVAAKGFGIVYKKEGRSPLPVPAVFIVATDGTIRFQYVNPNYTVRLDSGVLMAAAKAALK